MSVEGVSTLQRTRTRTRMGAQEKKTTVPKEREKKDGDVGKRHARAAERRPERVYAYECHTGPAEGSGPVEDVSTLVLAKRGGGGGRRAGEK